jgi:hypothetical protein
MKTTYILQRANQRQINLGYLFSVMLAGPDDKIRTVNDPELLDTQNTSYWTWESRTHINSETGLPYYEGEWILPYLREVSLHM